MARPKNLFTPQPFTPAKLALLASLCLIAAMATAVADDKTPAPSTRPLFEELNRETRSLFSEVAGSVVRVQLPLNQPGVASADPLAKWADRMDPDVRRRIEAMQRRAPENGYVSAEVGPTTGPSQTQPASSSDGDQHVILMQLRRFVPNGIGVIVDEQGHILIPRYVNAEAFVGMVPVVFADGRATSATFVASDRLTDVTVLQLHDIAAKPATLASGDLAAGTLLLVLSLNPAMNRLSVWEGWEPDFATLVTTDGRVAGFTRSGRYLCAATYEPVVRELIDHGHVRRPFLGVIVETVSADDPQRQADPSLAGTPALRIREIVAGSAAAKAGLQRGDLILALAGELVPDAPTFAAAIANRRGQTDMTVLRSSHRLTVTVDLQVQ